MILTLLQRLKPEVLEQLEINNAKYKSSVDIIKKVLESKYRYNELTMGEISSLYTWSNIELLKTSVWDLKYGDNIFIEAQYSEDV